MMLCYLCGWHCCHPADVHCGMISCYIRTYPLRRYPGRSSSLSCLVNTQLKISPVCGRQQRVERLDVCVNIWRGDWHIIINCVEGLSSKAPLSLHRDSDSWFVWLVVMSFFFFLMSDLAQSSCQASVCEKPTVTLCADDACWVKLVLVFRPCVNASWYKSSLPSLLSTWSFLLTPR